MTLKATTDRAESLTSEATPLFSVVVPTWNRAILLEETLESLLAQDFPRSDYEILIVDDGSTDDTIERLSRHMPRIRLVRQARSGISAARNTGIREAAGQYIVSFDSDDILFPHALAVYRQAIEAFDYPPILFSQAKSFRKVEELSPFCVPPSEIKCIKCADYFRKTITLSASNSNFVVQKRVLLDIGGYGSCDSGEDNDLILKAGTVGPVVKIEEPLQTGYRLHDSNVSRDMKFVAKGLSVLIRHERSGHYPGGWRRMPDRRAIIGAATLTAMYHYGFKAHQAPLGYRLQQLTELTMKARGMLLGAIVRMAWRKLYASETRLLPVTLRQNSFARRKP